MTNKRQVIKTGQTGSLRYQVGTYRFVAWWETDEDGKRKTYGAPPGLAPFVALKVIDAPAGRRE
jgi:hypothetical protein